jgi:epsilon-lactone hydrolase
VTSLRAKLVRLCARQLIKRRGRHETVAQTRQRIRSMERLIPAPPHGTAITTVDADGVDADEVVTPASHPDRHILYFHGGAYRIGSRSSCRHVTWRFASATQARLVAIDYRLAPEHPFPCAVEDAVSSYRWLLAKAGAAQRIAVIGESSGGGLALALLLKLRDSGLPLPAAAVALSPWTDLALTGATLTTKAEVDPILNAEDLPKFASDYLAGADPHNPYASPLYGDLSGLPSVLIQVGSDEIVLDDAVRMAEALRRANTPVELQVWPGMFHVWHLFAPVLPEALDAIEQAGNFVLRTLDAAVMPDR